METQDKHTFQTTLLRGGDWLNMHFIEVPFAVEDALVSKGVKRVLGELNDASFRLCLLSDGEGGRRIMVGTTLRKAAKTFEGGQVQATLWPDPDPDRIDLPEEFEIVLEQVEEAEPLISNLLTQSAIFLFARAMAFHGILHEKHFKKMELAKGFYLKSLQLAKPTKKTEDA